MVYSPLKSVMLRVLKAPIEPPDPPAGSHASVQVFRASPKFLRYRLLVLFLFCCFIALVGVVLFVVALFSDEPAAALLAVPIGMLVAFVLFLVYVNVRIDYDMRYYIVTDRSLRIREGAFIIKEMTLTYANVQNLRVVQGPIERAFGIKNLMVDTAGGGGAAQHGHGGGHKFQMAGVENAVEVRDLVLSYMKAAGGGSGLGDLDDPGERVGRAGAAAGPAVLAGLRGVRAAAASLRVAAESA